MKILKLLALYHDAILTAWALRELHPNHPDVPQIVLYNLWLNERIAELW